MSNFVYNSFRKFHIQVLFSSKLNVLIWIWIIAAFQFDKKKLNFWNKKHNQTVVLKPKCSYQGDAIKILTIG